ncbi:putative short-chain dehydrogenase [Colletotrichum kahawae]|uniref:Short-chain dehydrogenase n=1 Tax=Colletotrichum kahawae TaxID=34407 RepID=A0AAD9YJT0_COLKA|nr:putative short-chain dehydrogenase [Colletotrichum kahawae]
MSVRCSTLSPHKPTLTEENLPDQAGKVFLITGASGGIGKELVKILYLKNAKIWLAARSYSKTQAVINEIKAAHPTSTGEMIFLKLELDDLSTIKASAQEILSRETRLDVLWNNAGVMVPPQGSTTVQGHELQLGINNLGHQLFTQLLTPLLERTSKVAPRDSVRVIWVSVGITRRNLVVASGWRSVADGHKLASLHPFEILPSIHTTSIINLYSYFAKIRDIAVFTLIILTLISG